MIISMWTTPVQNKRVVTFSLNCDIDPLITYYPITFLHFILYMTLDSTVHVPYQICGIHAPERGAMAPSNNSLRLTNIIRIH